MAQNDRNRRSAIDGSTTHHPGYEARGTVRKRIEEIFGLIKTGGTLRKARYRKTEKLSWYFPLVAVVVYDPIWTRNLGVGAA
jgi:hypothetical protein